MDFFFPFQQKYVSTPPDLNVTAENKIMSIPLSAKFNYSIFSIPHINYFILPYFKSFYLLHLNYFTQMWSVIKPNVIYFLFCFVHIFLIGTYKLTLTFSCIGVLYQKCGEWL